MDDQTHNDITSTRGCFDLPSSEYNELDMPQKVALLKELINKKGYNTTQLSISMMNIYNTEYNKTIKPIELVMGLSKIVDYLLTEESCEVKNERV